MTTTTLADIAALEHQCVDVMARADTTPTQRTELAETLAKIRALKREYLTAHPSVLRKLSRDARHHLDALVFKALDVG